MYFASRLDVGFLFPTLWSRFVTMYEASRNLVITLTQILGAVCLLPTVLVGDEPQFEITSKAVLTKHPAAMFYHANFDLGVLPCAESGQVVLVLENPTENRFKFGKINKYCNCVEIKSKDGVTEIGPVSSHEFSMRLVTPRASDNGEASAGLSLRDESGKALIELRIKYQLSGVLSVKQKLHTFEIAPKSAIGQIRIPVLITAPIRADDLRLELSDSLRDLPFEIKTPGNGEVFVAAEVPGAVVDSGPLSGEVRIIDNVTKRKDGFFVTVTRGSDVRISPTVMRFLVHPEDDSKFSANAILSLPALPKVESAHDGASSLAKPRTQTAHKSKHGTEEPASDSSDASIEYRLTAVKLLVGGKPADVTVKRLSNRVFRLVLTINNDKSLDSDKGVEWDLTIRPLGRRELQSRFLIDD